MDFQTNTRYIAMINDATNTVSFHLPGEAGMDLLAECTPYDFHVGGKNGDVYTSWVITSPTEYEMRFFDTVDVPAEKAVILFHVLSGLVNAARE